MKQPNPVQIFNGDFLVSALTPDRFRIRWGVRCGRGVEVTGHWSYNLKNQVQLLIPKSELDQYQIIKPHGTFSLRSYV